MQRRVALAVAAALLLIFALTAPFATAQLPRIDAFIPILQSLFFVNDLITAVMLFSQYSVSRSVAILLLASGYLFASFIVVAHTLTFPGVFSPTGLLDAGRQSTAWLYFFWHFGFAAAVLVFALTKDNAPRQIRKRSTNVAIGCSIVSVSALVYGLIWLSTAGERFLPPFFLGNSSRTPLTYQLSAANILLCATALGILWVRRRSLLDQWLMIVLLAVMLELVLLFIVFNDISARFHVGFYAGRVYSLFTSLIVLVVLLAETLRLNARLVHSHLLIERERNSKLMNLAAVTGSISHEVRQPLMAIAMNGGAALRYLGHRPPNLEEASLALETLLAESDRASQILEGINGLLKSSDQGTNSVDLNELIREVLWILREELNAHEVAAETQLMSELPAVAGHRRQLQEVILNLAQNAIEAMGAMARGRRRLRLATKLIGDEVFITVEDSGPGIAPDYSTRLFDAFVTSKPSGMGLGLAICHMIIDRHGGQISAHSRSDGGALFQCSLPIRRDALRAP